MMGDLNLMVTRNAGSPGGNWALLDPKRGIVFNLDSRNDEVAAAHVAEWLNATDEKSVQMVLGAYHREHPYGPGLKPGSFFGLMLKALGHADTVNMERVAAGFPELIAAVRVWKFVYGSPEILEAYLNDRWFE